MPTAGYANTATSISAIAFSISHFVFKAIEDEAEEPNFPGGRRTRMTPIELNQKGFEALIAALGYADAVQFIKQFDPGKGDYTKERYQWLDALTLDDIWADLKQQQVPKE
jgi:hypothetical protein